MRARPGHRPTIEAEVRELAPVDGWRRYEPTGRRRALCSCGVRTQSPGGEWLPLAEVEAILTRECVAV